jgi:T5SS/PEP-CTERM-associated repeat protein
MDSPLRASPAFLTTVGQTFLSAQGNAANRADRNVCTTEHCAGVSSRVLRNAGLLSVAYVCLACALAMPARADDELAAKPTTYFTGAKLNEAGVAEICSDVAIMRSALMAHAKAHPSIVVWSTARKGSVGYAYHFKYGKEGDFILYHPDDYHISLGRDIQFQSGKTKADIDAALKNATGSQDAFLIADFADGSKITPKNSSNPNLIYFTYDFETSPSGGQRAEQRELLQQLADDVTEQLNAVTTKQGTAVTSFHTSFGYAQAGSSSASAIRDKVINALKKYGGYVTLSSSAMEVNAVGILESAHIDDATRYTTYIEESLRTPMLHVLTLGAGTVYSYPSLTLTGGTCSIAGPDWILIGDTQESDVREYIDWLEDDEALGVVSCDRDVADKGFLTVQAGGLFSVGATSEQDTGHLVIGLKPHDGGTVTLTGGGSLLAIGGDIDVGEYGQGTLNVSNGAAVLSYNGYLGYQPGSSGVVTLSGSGTAWQVLNDLHVGYRGLGQLSLSDGAQLLGDPSGITTLHVGTEVGSQGTLTLTGANTQVQLYDGSLVVGDDGHGTMTVENQAAVNSGFAYIGGGQQAIGLVQVTGSGSRLDVGYSLWVGVTGQGSLAIAGGGAATCNYLSVAAFPGAAGTMSVSGSSSSCTVAQDALIGGWLDSNADVPDRNSWNDGGTASMTIEHGAALSVGRTLWIGRSATVRSVDGWLEAENVDIFQGGKLLVTGGYFDVRRQLSVDGLLQSNSELTFCEGTSLVGNGTIDVPVARFYDGSLLAPGHSIGTLTFGGGLWLDSGSRTEIELGPNGQCDQLVVAQSLRLGGTLVLRGLSGGNPSWAYRFATAGSTTGQFDAVDASALPVAPKRVVFSDHWGLIKFMDLSQLAGTENARKVANTLDAAIDAGQSNPLVDRLITVGNNAAMSAGLAQMSGELYATLSAVGVQNTTNLYRVLSDRLRPDLGGSKSHGIAFASVAAACDDPPAGNLHLCSREPAELPRGDSGWGAWTLGYGLAGQASGNGAAQGVSYSTGGMLTAIERSLDFASRAGLFYGYGGSDVSTLSIVQNADIQTHQAGVYLCRAIDDDYALLAGGFGSDTYRARRSIAFDGTPETASGDYHGWQSAVYVERGRTLQGQLWSLQPYGALQYIHIRQEAFAESGAEPFDLDVGSSDFDSFRGIIGGRLLRRLGRRDAKTADFSFRTIWMHEFLRQTTGLVATSFATGPGSPFVLTGLDLGRDWVVLGPGCSCAIRDHVSLFANYDLQFNSRQTIHVGSGGVQFQW